MKIINLQCFNRVRKSILMLLCAVLLTACGESFTEVSSGGGSDLNQKNGDSDLTKSGEVIYAERCAGCHGVTGDGFADYPALTSFTTRQTLSNNTRRMIEQYSTTACTDDCLGNLVDFIYENFSDRNAPINAPSNLGFIKQSEFSYQLTWQNNANNATDISVYQSINNGGFVEINRFSNSNQTSYTVNNLQAGKVYEYYVMASNASSQSSPSYTTSFSIADENAPNSPTNLSANWADGKITLTWMVNNDGFVSQSLEAKHEQADWVVLTSFTNNEQFLSYPITELGNWQFRIRAESNNAYSAFSAIAKVYAQNGDSLFEQKCASCHGASGEGKNAYPALTGFSTLEQLKIDTARMEQGGQLICTGDCIDLVSDYVYASFTNKSEPVEKVSGQYFSYSNNELTINWENQAVNAQSIVIEVKNNDTNVWQAQTLSAQTTNFVISNTQPGYTYWARINVKSNDNESGFSDEFSFSIPGINESVPPSGVALSWISIDDVELTWVDNANDEAGYEIQKWQNDSWNSLNQTSANISSHQESMPAIGDLKYRVRTKGANSNADSMWVESNVLAIKTGETLYLENCSTCHADSGTGVGMFPPLTSYAPSLIHMNGEVDRMFIDQVDNSLCGVGCKESIAQYVYNNFSAHTDPNDGQVLSGEQLYVQKCQTCHYADGQGYESAPAFFMRNSETLMPGARQTQNDYINYIAENMPASDRTKSDDMRVCGLDCATKIYDYANVNFERPIEYNEDDLQTKASPQVLRLLSNDEYINSIEDLLGFVSPSLLSLPIPARVGGFDNNAHRMMDKSQVLGTFFDAANQIAVEATQPERLGNVLSCDVQDGASCSATQYIPGNAYAVGDVVYMSGQSQGPFYLCFKEAGWCSNAGYSPDGIHWMETWSKHTTCPSSDGGSTDDQFSQQCVTDFIDRFTFTAFKGDDSFSPAYQTMFENGVAENGQVHGIQTVIASVLTSPLFMYRNESGVELDGAPGIYKLTPLETATALSYLLWGSLPDDALLQKAINGELNTKVQIRNTATQMINHEKAQRQMIKFTEYWLGADVASISAKSGTAFVDAGGRVGVSAELQETIRQVIFENTMGDGTFKDLMLNQKVVVNKQLAEFYDMDSTGLTGAFEIVDVQTQDGKTTRGGVMRTGAFLAAHGHSNSSAPIPLGAFLRKNLMCHPLLDPPDPTQNDIDLSPPAPNANLTQREEYEIHTIENETCESCHKYINQLGYAFEQYKGDGQYRFMEEQLDDFGNVINTLNIDDSSVVLGVTAMNDGQMVVSANNQEFIEYFSTSDQSTGCYAQQYFRFAKGYVEGASDEFQVRDLKDLFIQSGGNIQKLMVDMTQLDSFIYRK